MEGFAEPWFCKPEVQEATPGQMVYCRFLCYDFMLIIEVDGGIHNSKIPSEHDQNRTSELEELGIRFIRFSNEEILNKLDFVL